MPRTAAINRLRAARSYPVVTMLAPAGYGKTTVLAQWASRDDRSFAWVSIEEGDDDPVLLCKHVAAALSEVGAIDTATAAALASARQSASSATRRLIGGLSSPGEPFVLVLDDVHLLRSSECGDVLASLAASGRRGSTIVLAGRALPRMPIARLRVDERLFEVGVDELALSRRESGVLLRQLGVELEASDLAELVERTEGWVTGLYLAAFPLREEAGKRQMPTANGVADKFLVEYFESEHFAGLSRKDLRFLVETSILDAMDGPLCDAVLGSTGSASKLHSLDRANLFVVPLDRSRRSYRYHNQFREVLQAELEQRKPGLAPALNRRAADWCEANGAREAAISYAHAARDVDRLARLVGPCVLPAMAAGKHALVEQWLGWFDEAAGLEKHPIVAVVGAWVHALRGRPAVAERWLDVAVAAAVVETPPDGSASIEPWIALVNAVMCRNGAEQMRSDADLALRELGPASWWRPTAMLLRGAAELLRGENDRAEATMADAAEAAETVGVAPSRIAALAERSLLVASRGDEGGAESLALQARALVDEHGLDADVRSAIAFAASARRALLRGDRSLADAELAKAEHLRPHLTHAIPWYAVHTSLELAHAHLSLLDLPGARAWLSHAHDILRRRPDLGVLAVRPKELEAEIDKVSMAQEGQMCGLTAAELRLLPILSSHLSFREIGERLYISRNTVKTQAISVYRKLGVSRRSEAIARAAELGLVEEPGIRSTGASTAADVSKPKPVFRGGSR